MTARFREANESDVEAVVALLSDDVLGRTREVAQLDAYLRAFRQMREEGANHLFVGESSGVVLATYQLTFISGLSLSATRRAQIEAVRVARGTRGTGIGAALMADAEARARAAGCTLLQLTSNAGRAEAHRFYERCGFSSTHVGFKKAL